MLRSERGHRDQRGQSVGTSFVLRRAVGPVKQEGFVAWLMRVAHGL